jgi:carbon-monoxide dehydrogenase large subunit
VANYVGARVARTEDPRLIRGEGRYVGDLTFPGMLHAGFVRSPHAHARILSVDSSEARSLPGVVAVYAYGDLPALDLQSPTAAYPPNLRTKGFFPLAREIVRYVGEAVAVVLAEEPEQLADAIDAVWVEYEPLPAIGDVEQALHGDPLVWEDVPRNIAVELSTGFGDVETAFAAAEVVVEGRFAFARSAGAAMEPRAVAAVPAEPGQSSLTIWASTQAPHNLRDTVAGYLDMSPEDLRVITADVGGGFGPKGRIYPEEMVVAALARHHNRPVRFVATRTDDLLTTAHGRGQIHRASLAARADGTILGLRDHFIQDAGAYTPSGMAAPMNTISHLTGPYRVPAAEVHLTGVYSNRVVTSPLRGGGRPEGVYVMERLLDRLASRLGLDRAEIRRRNFIPPEAFPYNTGMPHGRGGTVVYDSGNYPAYMDRALETLDIDSFRAEQARARAAGRYLGLGLVAFIESTGVGSEGARIHAGEDGSVTVFVGSPSNGQGHATTFAQMAADRMGVPLESISFVSGDTDVCPPGTGTFASRMGQYGGNAVSMAAQAVRERILQVAADMLEISPRDLVLVDGRVTVTGVPERGVDLAQVVQEAARRGESLTEERTFQPNPGNSWAGGVNAAIVEADIETGLVTLLRYLVIHDSGTLVNPTVVEGQIHGGVIHGVGNALYEECVYGDNEQPSTATFADYTLPGFGESPTIEIIHFETPSPFNPEGIKGAGEGGTIAAIPTIAGAVEDALSPFGVSISDIPIRAEEILRAIARARSG